jgi:thioredoxin-like negative regulator of GroEL
VSAPSIIPTVPGLASDPLSEANRHYRRGEFDAAIKSYNLVLQQNPQSPDAYAGLTRVYLKQKEVDQAFDIATKGLQATDSPTVHAALGEVLFRQGKIPEAEREWVNVINRGYPNARAYWGLARVRTALSLYAQAQQMLDKAHEFDPADPDILKYWVNSLSHAEQIKFWENYLASPTNDDAETRADMQHRLDYLRAIQNQSPHTCHLISHVPSMETSLLRILTDPTHLRGYGLAVSVNGAKGNLLLDTGASGIVIDQGMARKADIIKISDMDVSGVGDKGRSGGFVGFASSIKIGELEFQDCRVSVVEKRTVLGDDGLIGADMFNNFLVDIDFPREKLRLSPLPARPGEKTKQVTAPAGKEGSGPSGDNSSTEAASNPGAKSSPSAHHAPRDRYIAPEMQSYTPVYRFGQDLLIPTRMADQTLRLFAIDTGSSRNLLSLRAAHRTPRFTTTRRCKCTDSAVQWRKSTWRIRPFFSLGTCGRRIRRWPLSTSPTSAIKWARKSPEFWGSPRSTCWRSTSTTATASSTLPTSPTLNAEFFQWKDAGRDCWKSGTSQTVEERPSGKGHHASPKSETG